MFANPGVIKAVHRHASVPVPGRENEQPYHNTPSLRKRVYERDGHKCVKCGVKENLTLDHKIPKSKGGRTTMANLQTMCDICNNEKGDKLPEELPGDWYTANNGRLRLCAGPRAPEPAVVQKPLAAIGDLCKGLDNLEGKT